MKDYLNITGNGQTTFNLNVTLSDKALNLINQNDFDGALDVIDEALKNNDKDYKNWLVKGIILKNLKNYEKSLNCLNRAYELNDDEEILKAKGETLYAYAKDAFFPEMDYHKALELINQGLDVLPESEDSSEYWFLKAEILEALEDLVESQKCYLRAHKQFDRLEEFERQIDYITNTKDTLIIITGTNFYEYQPENGDIVCLVREVDNEHDPNAVRVEMNGEKVGYVANSDYTLIKEVKSATDIGNMIDDNQNAQILFIYLDEYVIAKLI